MKHLYILFLFLTFSAIAQDKTVVMPNASSIPEWVQLTEIESTLTPGSIIFAGTSGVLSQDATNLFFENSTDRMGIGANAASIGTEASLTTIRSFNGNAPGIWAVNSSGGNAAVTVLRAGNNVGAVLDVRMHGNSHATQANVGLLLSTGSGGLILSTESTQTVSIANGTATNILARFTNTGLGLGGVTVPSAMLHLPAGTATAGTAPMKLTTGTALTTPSDGALEYHTSHLYFTIGSTRYQLDQQGGGITNGAANNEVPKSDGTNLVASGVGIPSTANLDLGLSGTAGATRTLQAVGSATDVGITIQSKAAGNILIFSPTGEVELNGNTVTLDSDSDFTLSSSGNWSIATTGTGTGDLFAGTGGLDISSSGNLTFTVTTGTADMTITVSSGDGRYLIMTGLPTSSAGLPSGAVWANSNVLTIVP